MTRQMAAVAGLRAHPRNYNGHSPAQVADIAESLKRFGQRKPVTTWRGFILTGHGVVEAARLAGWNEVWIEPCPEEWDEATALAWLAADNELPRAADPDEAQLAALVAEVQREGDARLAELAAGSAERLKELLALALPVELPEDAGAQVDRAEELREVWGVELGQVWEIPSKTAPGVHRVACGDCTDKAVVDACLQGDKPLLMVTDPPYGVEYDADWRMRANLNNTGSYGYGELTNDDRADWREAWALFPGDVAYVWHAMKTQHAVANSLLESSFEIRAEVVWAKNTLVISQGHYHPQHESCFYAVRKGATAQWIGDRKQTTLWQIDKPQKSETGHSTQKPLECMERPIRNHDAALVYDPFLGSGTTLVACESTGRLGRGVEISPAYVAVTLQRLADLGLEPYRVNEE